jgi:hypothetical protein
MKCPAVQCLNLLFAKSRISIKRGIPQTGLAWVNARVRHEPPSVLKNGQYTWK